MKNKRPTSRKKAAFVHIRCSEALKDRLEQAANRMGVSSSTYVRLKLAEAFGLSKEAAIAEIAR